MDKIIDSFNIYTCSDRGEENPSSTGDVFELNMNNSKIDIQKGQFFRLSLINFNMSKSFTNINSTNDRFILYTKDILGVNNYTQIIIPHGNYRSINSITTAFSKAIRDVLLLRAQQGGSQATDVNTSDQKPDTTDTADGNSDNIISFKIKFKDTNKNFYISPQFNINDSHILLKISLIKKILLSYLYRAKSLDYKILESLKIVHTGYWLVPKELICIDQLEKKDNSKSRVQLKIEEYLTYRYGDWRKKVSNWSTTKHDRGLYFF